MYTLHTSCPALSCPALTIFIIPLIHIRFLLQITFLVATHICIINPYVYQRPRPLPKVRATNVRAGYKTSITKPMDQTKHPGHIPNVRDTYPKSETCTNVRTSKYQTSQHQTSIHLTSAPYSNVHYFIQT